MRRIRTTEAVGNTSVGPLKSDREYLVPPEVARALVTDDVAVYIDDGDEGRVETAEAPDVGRAERAVTRASRAKPNKPSAPTGEDDGEGD